MSVYWSIKCICLCIGPSRVLIHCSTLLCVFKSSTLCVCVGLCVCVRLCACMRAFVCVRACVRACVRVCACGPECSRRSRVQRYLQVVLDYILAHSCLESYLMRTVPVGAMHLLGDLLQVLQPGMV